MRPVAISLTTAVLSAAILGASVKVTIKFDRSATLTEPRTYTWLDSPPYLTDVAPDLLRDERLEKSALDGPIRAAVDRELTARRWRPVAHGDNPEFEVVYYVFITAGANASVLGSYYQYTTGWAPAVYAEGGLATTAMTVVEKGSLVVDLIDRERKTAVWRGTAVGTLERTREQSKRLEIIADAVKKLFRKFPPR